MAHTSDGSWSDPSYWSEPAEQAFARALREGRWEDLINRLRGRRATRMSFEEVTGAPGRVLEGSEVQRSVPISQIVGSVGKGDLFTRTFRPRSSTLRARWKRAYAVVHGMRGYEPIELYEVEGRFYMVDGHFRTSVARAMGQDTIEARIRRWA